MALNLKADTLNVAPDAPDLRDRYYQPATMNDVLKKIPEHKPGRPFKSADLDY